MLPPDAKGITDMHSSIHPTSVVTKRLRKSYVGKLLPSKIGIINFKAKYVSGISVGQRFSWNNIQYVVRKQ